MERAAAREAGQIVHSCLGESGEEVLLREMGLGKALIPTATLERGLVAWEWQRWGSDLSDCTASVLTA